MKIHRGSGRRPHLIEIDITENIQIKRTSRTNFEVYEEGSGVKTIINGRMIDAQPIDGKIRFAVVRTKKMLINDLPLPLRGNKSRINTRRSNNKTQYRSIKKIQSIRRKMSTMSLPGDPTGDGPKPPKR